MRDAAVGDEVRGRECLRSGWAVGGAAIAGLTLFRLNLEILKVDNTSSPVQDLLLHTTPSFIVNHGAQVDPEDQVELARGSVFFVTRRQRRRTGHRAEHEDERGIEVSEKFAGGADEGRAGW